MSITDGKLKLIISDFDGVFTDNYVWTDSNGNELVKTSRSDSFSISNFKKFVDEMKIELDFLILSTETNSVVTSRAQKLGLKAICGVVDKKSEVQKILHENISKHRFSVLVLHRRAGKTVMCINHMIRDAMYSKTPNSRYAFISPTFK